MKKLIPIIITLLLLVSCKKTNDVDAIKKKISNLSSYCAVSRIIIYSSKGTSEYKIQQYYLEPNLIKLETLEPDYLKGKILVTSGEAWKIYHPLINNSFLVDKLKDDDELIYLGIIQKNMISLEDVEYKKISRNGKEYITLNFKLPNGNEYRNSVILYINREEYNPEFMEILDIEGVTRVSVTYSNFQYNPKLDNSIFKLD